ncbi:hypothetical protein AUP68_09860 [Ilyonectria robusta]
MAEVNVGIMCACMPAIRLLLAQTFPKILGSSRRSVTEGQGDKDQSGNGNLRVNTNSDIDRSQHKGIPSKGVDRQRIGDIDLSDGDEARLVHMDDLDHKRSVFDP